VLRGPGGADGCGAGAGLSLAVRRDLRGGQEAGHRDGGDAAQVGAPGRGRCGPAAGHDIGRACRDQAAEAENAGCAKPGEILKAASAFSAAELDRPPAR
jgi:hypothetical protein